MKKLVVVALFATGLALTLSAPSEAEDNIPKDDPLIENPWDDDCFWYPDSCQEPCDTCTSTSCYTCLLIPEGPNGEPSTYHCDTNTSGGYDFCSADASGCSLSGDCGSFE